MGKCKFDDSWKKIPKYSSWLEHSKDVEKFYCRVCLKEVFCRSGIQSLNQHAESANHISNETKNKVKP